MLCAAGMSEPSHSQSQFDCINAGINGCQSGVGYVHKAQISGPGYFSSQVMHADSPGSGEIDPGSSGRDLRISEQSSSANLEVRHYAAARI
jgi:hypothetical protein